MGGYRFVDGNFDPDSGEIRIVQEQYIGDILQHNLDLQKDGTNGFTRGRSMRLVGQIPGFLYADPDFRALDPQEKQFFLKWFLERHPEYRTVERLKTSGPNDGHIIIK